MTATSLADFRVQIETNLSDPPKEAFRFSWLEIPDRRAREESDDWAASDSRGQLQGTGEILDERYHFHTAIVGSDCLGSMRKGGLADIDWYVQVDLRRRIKDQASLSTGAAAEFHEGCAGGDEAGNRRRDTC